MSEVNRTLREAAQAGNLAAVQAMLGDADIEIDAADGDGNTALLHAAREGHAAVVETLLTAGADRTLTNNAGDDARSAALHHGHVKLAAGLAPDKRQSSAGSALIAPLLWPIFPLAWFFTDPFAISEPGRLLAYLGVVLAAVGVAQGVSLTEEPLPVGAAMLAIGVVLFFVGYFFRRDKSA